MDRVKEYRERYGCMRVCVCFVISIKAAAAAAAAFACGGGEERNGFTKVSVTKPIFNKEEEEEEEERNRLSSSYEKKRNETTRHDVNTILIISSRPYPIR